ncbi:DUF167 domain-containing protein [Coraliomargarita parva]|uniref:DUF167 domain-containing protein n=1 Tax=Coraliomargarita parva TaxID=3014050 RepID=UPI0022B2F283|nr:DUF167 domain-containing protein [Coraliomargarita parva]
MSSFAELNVRVIPNASRDEVVGWYGEALKLKTATPPEAGKANKAICALLEKHLKLPKRSVSVVRGQTSQSKTLRIEGLDPAALRERLPQ